MGRRLACETNRSRASCNCASTFCSRFTSETSACLSTVNGYAQPCFEQNLFSSALAVLDFGQYIYCSRLWSLLFFRNYAVMSKYFIFQAIAHPILDVSSRLAVSSSLTIEPSSSRQQMTYIQHSLDEGKRGLFSNFSRARIKVAQKRTRCKRNNRRAS